MIKYLLLIFLLFGCDNEIDCKSSKDCKRYGTCINDGSMRCITGCEEQCKQDGFCTPTLDGCTAKFNDCNESKVCREFGRCSAVNGYCIPTTDEQCQKSMECGIKGACKIKNNECMPKVEMDCIKSWDCLFNRKCFLKLGERNRCTYSEEL